MRHTIDMSLRSLSSIQSFFYISIKTFFGSCSPHHFCFCLNANVVVVIEILKCKASLKSKFEKLVHYQYYIDTVTLFINIQYYIVCIVKSFVPRFIVSFISLYLLIQFSFLFLSLVFSEQFQFHSHSHCFFHSLLFITKAPNLCIHF